MKVFARMGIFWRILSAMTGLIVAMAVVVTVFQIASQKTALEKELDRRISMVKESLRKRGRAIAFNLARQVEEGIASFNFYNVTDSINKAVKDDPEILYAILMDQSRVAYVHTFRPKMQQEVLNGPRDLFAVNQKAPLTSEFVYEGRQVMEFIMPLRVSINPWGVLRLGFSLDALEKDIVSSRQDIHGQVNAAVTRSILIALVTLVIGTLAVFLISARLSRPLVRLTASARELAKGNFEAAKDLGTGSAGEVGILATAFVEMAGDLKASYGKIEEYSQNLEQKVAARTEELQRYAADLKQAKDSLEEYSRQLSETAREMELAKNSAEAATRSKSSFLANMSHEIRTPMNAIVGMTDLTLKTELSALQRDYLEKVRYASRSLIGIINDILDFSKIEAGKIELEEVEFSLDRVMRGLADMLSARASEKGIEFLVSVGSDVPATLLGDSLRLGQILLNLTSNAIKFTDRGEVLVRVSLLSHEERVVRLRFSVKDTGIGIDEERKGRLFHMFLQGDESTARKYGGTGLGLAISKGLVEVMGGRIGVESEAGAGCLFTVDLGFKVPETVQPNLLMPPELLRGMEILVVDDNATSREILVEMLKSMSFKTSTVSSGEEALRVLASDPSALQYRIVLLDWQMPGLDGLETARRIREMKHANRVPLVIMITGFGPEKVRQQAREIGINCIIAKPVNESDLLENIMEAIGIETRRERLARSATQTAALETEKIRGIKVLLVEDNAVNQQVALAVLGNAKVQTDIAGNGQEAVNAVRANDYDAVLMDLQMPVMDGYEATRQIRRLPGKEKLPIIAMTAHAMNQAREMCLECGMDDHLAKPIDADQLYAALARRVVGARTGPAETPSPRAPERQERPPGEGAFPGLDIPAALARLNGNRSLLARLFKDFSLDFGNADEKLHKLLADGERKEAVRLAHTMKGMSGNLGADGLYRAARELEAALGSDEGKVPALLEAFGGELRVALSSAAAWSRQEQAAPPTAPPADGTAPGGETERDKLALLLSETDNLLAEGNIRAEENIGKLKRLLTGPGWESYFLAMDESLRLYDMKKARQALAEISQRLSGVCLKW